ncbi:MAG: hypothetical protein R2786_05095 [Flavobacteriaceae bacterium]
MKLLPFLLTLLFFSCKKHPNSTTDPLPAEDAVEIATETEMAAEGDSHYFDKMHQFKEAFFKLPSKLVPFEEASTFNSFMDKDGFESIDAEAFSLPKIYENWYREDYDFQAISGYRLQLSEDFYTAVLTVIINNNTMQSILINYNNLGVPIDSELVAYDEKGEDGITNFSKIEKHKITYFYTVATEESFPYKSTALIKIDSYGEMEEMGKEEIFFDLVAEVFNIPLGKRIDRLNAFKPLPNSPNEAVVVVPEIAAGNPEEDFSLNTHIAIVNVQNKDITHRYYESHKTNGWVSDAIRLDEIGIDFPAISVNEKTNPIEVKVRYYGSSRVNPYYQETISLFVKEGENLKKIMHHFTVEKSVGEIDGPCTGTTFSEKKAFIMEKEKTNGFFDISIQNTLVKTIDFEDENGECQSKDTTSHEFSLLKFDGTQYKEDK